MVFFGTYNRPSFIQITPVEARGQFGLRGLPDPFPPKTNYTIIAYNVDTGQLVWEYHSLEAGGFRGGLFTSGGVVYPVVIDGYYRALDADTGQVLDEQIEDSSIQSSIGTDSDGKMLLIRIIGSRGGWRGPQVPGAIMAFALPDRLPEERVVVREFRDPKG